MMASCDMPLCKLYSMPYGNGQVLDIARNGLLFDLVLLEDGRVVALNQMSGLVAD